LSGSKPATTDATPAKPTPPSRAKPSPAPQAAKPPASSLEGGRDIKVFNKAGRIITDIDHVENGVLWEEKSATGLYGEGKSWISKHIDGKFAKYLEARQQLPSYESAPVGFRFTDAVTPEFKTSVENAVDALRKNNPGVRILLKFPE
jgi:hypothetical protein